MAEELRHARRERAVLLGDRIALRRRQFGWTQEQLAQELAQIGAAVSPATVSAWEWGRPRMATDQLIALSRALLCTTSYLLGLSSDPTRWEPDQVDWQTTPDPSDDGKPIKGMVAHPSEQRVLELVPQLG